MIDIVSYFRENVEKNDYYSHYYFLLGYTEKNYVFFDDKEVIESFKDIIKPENEKNISFELEEKFILECFYLNEQGYIIKEFPEFLERPKSNSKSDLYDFMYRQIRTYIIEHMDNYTGTVTWDERRKLINSLHFAKRKYETSREMEDLIRMISTGSKSFKDLTSNEKLENICNAFEYLLKKSKKENYESIDKDEYLGIVSDDIIRDYRQKIQCFRHSKKTDIEDRNKLTDKQKDLLIRYGIFLIETLIER